jgi:carboxymethylenebutenolidase
MSSTPLGGRDMEKDAIESTDYLATPTQGRGAGILVLHSGRGLTQFITQFCHRLAREGFVALAPDVFGGQTAESLEASRQIKQDLDEEATLRQLEDMAEFLRQHEVVSRKHIGILGIGYGAEWACRIAPALSRSTGAIVLFYGYRETEWEPVDAPVLGHFAQLDHEIPESRVNEIRNQLKDSGVPHDLFVYPNTEPSFFEMDASARHDTDAARLAWERTREFLRKNLL